ncbi:MAG: D-alanine--D-alanine ligase [Desulfobacteraceae bacterium]|nr:MAG: D-alanine--D-alanine ligase [Desulfobacteraceae bacterium]
MRIAVVHNALDPGSTADEQDVLAQADAVEEAARRCGHQIFRLACDLNLAAVQSRLMFEAPDGVFNLVEALAGTGRLLHLFPALLDAMRLPYTGSSAEALFLTSNKVLAKAWLEGAGIPTPPWVGPCEGRRQHTGPLPERRPERWIIKSVWEHASIGLDENAFVDGAASADLPRLLSQRAPQLGGACFAEAFIEGREFNISILDGIEGPRVLPPAEILFEGFSEGKPCIVDYRAKWDANSYEYHHTPRRYDFGPEDNALVEELTSLALACWHLFDLSGYARVDFRVDAMNRPWVLEINANPCLSPDAGFAAAVAQAGLHFDQTIDAIIQQTCLR